MLCKLPNSCVPLHRSLRVQSPQSLHPLPVSLTSSPASPSSVVYCLPIFPCASPSVSSSLPLTTAIQQRCQRPPARSCCHYGFLPPCQSAVTSFSFLLRLQTLSYVSAYEWSGCQYDARPVVASPRFHSKTTLVSEHRCADRCIAASSPQSQSGPSICGVTAN